MSKINNSRKKKSFSLLTLIAIIFAVFSISFGTIIYSANSVSSETERKTTPPAESAVSGVFNKTAKVEDDAAAPDAIFTVNDNGDTKDANAGNGICADSAGKCTLRAAIEEANASAGSDEINFNFNAPTEIQLNSGLSPASLTITQNLKITGKGARNLTIKGNQATTAGIFKVNSSVTAVSLTGLTVTNSANFGINNEGELSLADVAVKQNGTGINNSGKLTITRALINGNSKSGLILAAATEANISNTTISGNQSATNGGGINSASANVTLNNVTITNNSATEKGGGVYFASGTDGFFVRNTIIAGNTGSANTGDISNGSTGKFTSRGNNIIGQSNGNIGFENNTNNDKVGTNNAPIDPKLGALQNNGGQTDTHAVLLQSPAIKAGSNCVFDSSCGTSNPASALTTDQRGTDFPRVYQETTEIGAFEAFYPAPIVTSLSPESSVAGQESFELIVTGSKFVKDSVVNWKGEARTTTFVSETQLKIQVSATDIAAAGNYAVTVTNPEPGGGTSQAVTFTVPECSYAISPESQNFNATGGSATINITAQNGCRWTATSDSTWLTFTGNSTGTGNGTLSVSVAANTGASRTGKITIGGKTFTVNQDSGCAVSLNPTSTTIVAAGSSTSSFSIASGSGCAWTASTTDSWVNITSAKTGTGNGTITFTVAPNTGAQRTGKITVNDKTFDIIQESGCTYSITDSPITIPAGTRSGSITVTTNAGCTWSAQSNQSWVTLSGNNNDRSGTGTVQYSVTANVGPARDGTISVAGKIFTIKQEEGCVYTLTPTSQNFVATGGTLTFNVTATDVGCTWTASSNKPWVTFTSGTSGIGNGTVSFTVAANTGIQRSAVITVNGKTFDITQESGCRFTLAANTRTVAAAGETFTVGLTASDPGCGWTAESNVTWITVSPISGTGNPTVTLNVVANTGPQREGTVKIGGQTLTVKQNSGCTYSLSFNETTFNAPSASGSFGIKTSNQSCKWTATTTDPWITFLAGSSTGVGDGEISYAIELNVSPERRGTIVVEGQTFTIIQRNGCNYSLPNTSMTVSAAGGSYSFVINSGARCPWDVTSSESWVVITSGSTGTGSSSITFTVAANSGPSRSATITVGGKSFTITQDSGCAFVLNPPLLNIGSAGGTYSVAVTATDQRCTWSAQSNISWVTFSGTTNGTGNGTVQVVVAPNISPERSGTITIAGKPLNIIQGNGCTYSLSPTSASVNENGGDRSFNVTAGPNCTWNAVSNDSWITITSAASGSGGGTVQLRISANNGQERRGTVTVENQQFTVYQVNLIVSNLNDSGAGSLRQAVINANNTPGNDVITFSVNGSIGLTSGEIEIINNGDLEIRGNGAYSLKISGNNQSRIFFVNKANVTLRDLTLMNGNGIGVNSNSTNPSGGAVYVKEGKIIIDNLEIIGNTIGGGENGNGAGVFLDNVIDSSIKNSTFYNNKCKFGAGVYVQFGSVSIINSSFNENAVTREGGAVYSVGKTTLLNTTIYNNITSNPNPAGAGISIWGGALFLGNTIVSGNSGPDITFRIGEFTSLGNNLIGDSLGDSSNTENSISYLSSDILDKPPLLAPLSRYGGSTTTVALMPGSPAIDAGNNNNSLQSTDQRGMPRIINNIIDIGAFENAFSVMPSSSTLPNGALNSYYSQAISAARIDGATVSEPFTFSLLAGTLPPGLTISDRGILQGTPEVPGVYTFYILAALLNQQAGVNKYTISVNCTFSINRTTQSMTAAGGADSFNITSSSGCNWTAASDANWINITSGRDGSGNGTISFTVQPNTGGARTGKITVGGQTFRVEQAAGCNYSISESNVSVAAVNSTGSFNVSAGSGCSWTTSTTTPWVTITNGNSGTGNGTVNYTVAANNSASRTGSITAAGKTLTIIQEPYIAPVKSRPFDFDGDGKSDVAVYRPESGEWHVQSSTSGYGMKQWGMATDKIVPADYDGDGKTDHAVFRDGYWLILASTAGFTSAQFGLPTDIPVPADFDGDGKSDVAVYRPSNGYWYILGSQSGFLYQQWGDSADKPIVGDFDGDGKSDMTVFRPSNGIWYMLQSRDGFSSVQWGEATDKPIVGDYDGDGRMDVAVFRPSSGYWYILQSRNGFTSTQWGTATDLPTAADYDGDGKTDFSVYRNGTWHLLRSSNGYSGVSFGFATDKPIQNSFIY